MAMEVVVFQYVASRHTSSPTKADQDLSFGR